MGWTDACYFELKICCGLLVGRLAEQPVYLKLLNLTQHEIFKHLASHMSCIVKGLGLRTWKDSSRTAREHQTSGVSGAEKGGTAKTICS